jgi:hypothetical protein
MNIFRLAAELFLIYLLYKFIFNFIIPIYQSTKKIKKQFGEMQSKMQDNMNAYPNPQRPVQPEHATKQEGDYIEYEEIKK